MISLAEAEDDGVRASAWTSGTTCGEIAIVMKAFLSQLASQSVSFNMVRESEDVAHRPVKTSRRHQCRLFRQRQVLGLRFVVLAVTSAYVS